MDAVEAAAPARGGRATLMPAAPDESQYGYGGSPDPIADRCRHLPLSRADVADFMLSQLASDAYRRAAPGICS